MNYFDADARELIAEEIVGAVDEMYSSAYDMPLGTGPHVPFRGGSAPNLRDGYTAALEASGKMGTVTWRSILSPQFFALMAEYELPVARAAAVSLAASLIAMIEDVDMKIEGAAASAGDRSGDG